MVTKRTKNLKKQDIPSLDDPISKLNHIGKETVKKLNELRASAEEAKLDLALPADLHRWAWLTVQASNAQPSCIGAPLLIAARPPR